MPDWFDFDSLHVISDLHLGGDDGFQIFGSTDELVWLIDHVAGDRPTGRHGLLINGDFIDFLADAHSTYFDPDGAIAKIDGVWKRFEPIFLALQRLLFAPNRVLIVNLGNHDLELALPWVRAHLTRKLTDGDEAAQARLAWVTDGTGVRCRVGGARVVCLHGNEVDSWNVADYERLRRIGRDYQLGLGAEPWIPNAGTQLVIEVMNKIKRQYPFVDLLKPEMEGVLPILAALETGVHRKLIQLAGIASRKASDTVRMRAGFLDGEPPEPPVSCGYAPSPVFAIPSRGGSAAALLDDVESAWRQGVTPIALVRGTQNQELGFWSAAANWISDKPKSEVLREALESLDRDRSFNPSENDQTFRDMDAMVGAEIEVLIVGHTHLERSLPRTRGRGHYFNTGTWARLIRVEPEVRRDGAAFQKLFSLLDGGTMTMLDDARIPVDGKERKLVVKRNTVVIVERRASPQVGVDASLCHVLPATATDPIRLNPADAATWSKV